MPPKPSAFLEAIVALLLPYFTDAAADLQDARTEVIETLASYATRTRSELLQAAQAIALGMTALDVLAEARAGDLSMSMRIRHRSCANGLNRAMLNSERALQRHQDQAASGPAAEPAAKHATASKPGIAVVPPRLSQPQRVKEHDSHIWAGAMMDALKQMGVSVQRAPSG